MMRNDLLRLDRVAFAVVIVLLAFLVTGCKHQTPTAVVQFELEGRRLTPPINAEVVYTPAGRQIGLQYRKQMASEEGMLFIFSVEEPRSFWMKNTYLELDMIFLNSARQVVAVIERAKPLTEQPRESIVPALYVLELNGGSVAKWGIRVGATMVSRDSLPAAS